eukprot:gene1168-1339_t
MANQKALLYLTQKRAALRWIEAVLEVSVDKNVDFVKTLQDGVLLCRVMQAISPTLIPRISVPDPAAPRHQTQFRHSENVSFFLAACTDMGVPRHKRFVITDLLQAHPSYTNLRRILECLESVCKTANADPNYEFSIEWPTLDTVECNFSDNEIAEAEQLLAQFTIRETKRQEVIKKSQTTTTGGANGDDFSVADTKKALFQHIAEQKKLYPDNSPKNVRPHSKSFTLPSPLSLRKAINVYGEDSNNNNNNQTEDNNNNNQFQSILNKWKQQQTINNTSTSAALMKSSSLPHPATILNRSQSFFRTSTPTPITPINSTTIQPPHPKPSPQPTKQPSSQQQQQQQQVVEAKHPKEQYATLSYVEPFVNVASAQAQIVHPFVDQVQQLNDSTINKPTPTTPSTGTITRGRSISSSLNPRATLPGSPSRLTGSPIQSPPSTPTKSSTTSTPTTTTTTTTAAATAPLSPAASTTTPSPAVATPTTPSPAVASPATPSPVPTPVLEATVATLASPPSTSLVSSKSSEDSKRASLEIRAAIRIQRATRRWLERNRQRIRARDNAYRERIAQELTKTEVEYLARLTFLRDKVLKDLREAISKGSPIISEEEIRAIFSELEAIINTNTLLLQELNSRVNDWNPDTLIGDIFLKFSKFLMIYSQYSLNYEVSMEVLNEVKKQQKFKAYLNKVKEIKEEIKLRGLEDYLIRPIQRIPSLEKAYTSMNSVAEKMNEAKRNAENRMKLADIQEKLEGSSGTGNASSVVKAHRRFVKEGEFYEVTPKGKKCALVLYLFNDILAVTRPSKSSGSFFGKQKTIRLQFEHSYSLPKLKLRNLEDTPTHQNAFRVSTTSEDAIVICATDKEAKIDWFAAINAEKAEAEKSEKDQEERITTMVSEKVADTKLKLEQQFAFRTSGQYSPADVVEAGASSAATDNGVDQANAKIGKMSLREKRMKLVQESRSNRLSQTTTSLSDSGKEK